MSKAILLLSFGTTYEQARREAIEATHRFLQAAYPATPIYQAYSSSIVRRILAERNIAIPSVTEALQQIKKDGVCDLIVQPTHLLPGEEYEKIRQLLWEHRDLFDSIRLGDPLLTSTGDLLELIPILAKLHPLDEDEALIWMGHGSPRYSNTLYAALDYMFKQQGFPHIYVGTVEAYPELTQVMALLKQTPYRRLALAPLLFVAGDHVLNDMAGEEEDSWAAQFREAGYEVRSVLKGLGEFDAVRRIYQRHLEEAEELA